MPALRGPVQSTAQARWVAAAAGEVLARFGADISRERLSIAAPDLARKRSRLGLARALTDAQEKIDSQQLRESPAKPARLGGIQRSLLFESTIHYKKRPQ